MIIWVLTAALLGNNGELEGAPIKEYLSLSECKIAAESLREKIRTEHPVEIPPDIQIFCWPKAQETSKPKAQLIPPY